MVTVQQIDTYEQLYSEVDAFDGIVLFENWFRVDARPFKQSLLNTIRHWSLMFKQHLINHITHRSLVFLTMTARSKSFALQKQNYCLCKPTGALAYRTSFEVAILIKYLKR